MSSLIRTVVKKPGLSPEVVEIADELDHWKDIVGGYLEAIPFGNDGIILWCNEEGKLLGLPANIVTKYHIIVGNVFFTRSDEYGEIGSLTEEDVKMLLSILV